MRVTDPFPYKKSEQEKESTLKMNFFFMMDSYVRYARTHTQVTTNTASVRTIWITQEDR